MISLLTNPASRSPMAGKLLEGYTIVLALQDFMPVMLSAAGLFALAIMIGRAHPVSGRMAVLGATFVTVGGLSKAAWKLIMAASNEQIDITVMDDALFWLMGPGFTLMAYALSYALRVMRGAALKRANVWLVPCGVVGLFVAVAAAFLFVPGSRTWNAVMLGMTTLGSFVLGGLAIRAALKAVRPGIAALFAFNLVCILVLAGMARVPSQTVALQWFEQILNTFSNGAFLLASLRLVRALPGTAVWPRAGAVAVAQ